MIEVGQIYASTHSTDMAAGWRQRRRVVDVVFGPDFFVWLQTEGASVAAKPSRIRLRSPKARTIPGHRLVSESPESER